MYKKIHIIVWFLVSAVAYTNSFGNDSTNVLPPKKIVVDAKKYTSNDPDNGWKKGYKLHLQAGNWEVKPVSGAWSAWGSDSWRSPDVKGAWTWNVQIKVPSSEQSQCLGECGNWWRFKSEKEADLFAKSQELQPYSFSLESAGDVYFWIFDAGNETDNRGKITIEIYSVQ